MQANTGENIGYLTREVIRESKKLVELEAELFQAEMLDKVKASGKQLAPLLYGGVAATCAGVFLGLALVNFLVAQTSIPFWGAYLIVAALLAISVPVVLKLWKPKPEEALPKETIASIKENIQCLKTPTH